MKRATGRSVDLAAISPHLKTANKPMNQRPNEGIFEQLMETVRDRKSASADESYTASLFSGGLNQICQKVAEEAEELLEAAQQPGDSQHHQIHETADLIYHVWVLLAQLDIPLEDIKAELTRRFGTSGLQEKAARTDPQPKPNQP